MKSAEKRSSKVLSLLLVLAMVMSLSLNVFAAPNAGTRVTVDWEGEEMFSKTVTSADVADLCAGKAHLYTVEDYVTDALSEYTAADALIAAYLMEMDQKSYTPDEIAYAWYNTAEEGQPAHYGLYFTVYNGVASDAGGKYYFVSSRKEGDKTYYTYYWEGESWKLYIDGKYADKYSSEYALSDVTSIQFSYGTTRSEDFETDTYIPGAEPAP